MADVVDLKLCPFCGGPAETFHLYGEHPTAGCRNDKCGVQPHAYPASNLIDAIVRWNSRAPTPPQWQPDEGMVRMQEALEKSDRMWRKAMEGHYSEASYTAGYDAAISLVSSNMVEVLRTRIEAAIHEIVRQEFPAARTALAAIPEGEKK